MYIVILYNSYYQEFIKFCEFFSENHKIDFLFFIYGV